MSAPSLETLTQRLDRLEREIRIWRATVTLILSGSGLVLLLGATPPKLPNEIRAKSFVVVDDAGLRRAVLAAEYQGVSLMLDDAQRKASARLSVSDGGLASLELQYDGRDSKRRSQDIERLFAAKSPKEKAKVIQTFGITSSVLTAGVDGHTALDLGGDGTSAVAITAAATDARGITLYDRNGVGRLDISVRADGSPSMTLADFTGKDRAVLGHTSIAARRTGTVEQLPASSVVLFDTDGKVIWRAP